MKKILVVGLFGSLILTACKKETTNPVSSTTTATTSVTVNTNPDVITFNPNMSYGSVTDIDGNVYKTVNIAGKEWMAENLKVKKFSNGDTIGKVDWFSDASKFINWDDEADRPLYKFLDFDSLSAVKSFKTVGLHYNWSVVNDTRNACPSGWHIPSENEYTNLINNLGGMYLASNKLKEVGLVHWKESLVTSTNSSGFTAIPSGSFNMVTINRSSFAYFWTSTLVDNPDVSYKNSFAKVLFLSSYDSIAKITSHRVRNAGSIRCIKD